MASSRSRSPDVGFPQLHKDQLDMIIDALLCTVRDRDLAGRVDLAESTIGDLTAYYTRKWGLPPAISRRVDRVRDRAAG